MKKLYIIPEIDVEEMISEEVLVGTSDTAAANSLEYQLSKERETVDFSSDSDWDF